MPRCWNRSSVRLDSWPESWTLATGCSSLSFLSLGFAFLLPSLSPEGAPRIHPCDRKVVLRLNELVMWENPVKASCVHDWIQLGFYCKNFEIGVREWISTCPTVTQDKPHKKLGWPGYSLFFSSPSYMGGSFRLSWETPEEFEKQNQVIEIKSSLSVICDFNGVFQFIL